MEKDALVAQRTRRIIRMILNNIVWIILFLCIATFSATIPGYFSIRNYINIVYHSVFIGLLSIAESYCLISGNMDLSVESVAAFGAIYKYMYKNKAIVFVCCPYLHLVEQWANQIEGFGIKPIIVHSGVNWRDNLLRKLRQYSSGKLSNLFITNSMLVIISKISSVDFIYSSFAFAGSFLLNSFKL